MLHALYFLAVRSSLKLHPSTLAFELPLSICQWRTLDISFTKLLLNILEPYLVKCNLPLLRCCALIFLELSKCSFLYLVLLNVNLLPSIPFSFNFLSSVLKITVETLTSLISFLSRHGRFIIDSAISIEHFPEDRSFVQTCKMK